MKALNSASLMQLLQFLSFAGLVVLSNAGLRAILESRFSEIDNIYNILIRLVIMIVLIALVYPQFRGGSCCKCDTKNKD